MLTDLMSRGCGFVRFTDKSDHQRALIEMQGVYCGNRPIRTSDITPKNEIGGVGPAGMPMDNPEPTSTVKLEPDREDTEDPMSEQHSEKARGKLVVSPTEQHSPRDYELDLTTDRYSRTQCRERSHSPQRGSSDGPPVSDDTGRGNESVRIEVPNSRRRRSSFCERFSVSTAANEDKLDKAATYQDDVAGPNVPLTAESLKRQQRLQSSSSRSVGSSRSTRSSTSSYESDHENVTIRVTGSARVRVGGADITCDEGGEIEIKRRKSLLEGRKRLDSEYERGNQVEDRKS
jgi:RNA recognition motif-containing protein